MPDIMPWHKNQLLEPEYTRVDLVKEGANSKAHIKLFKSKGGGNPMTFEEILKSLKPEHADVIQKALDAEKKKADDAEAAKKVAEDDAKAAKDEVEKSKAPAAGDSPEEILKSVKDPAVKALLETQIAKAKIAEEEVRKARETQLNSEAIAKAKEVPNVGAEEAVLADVYKKLKNVDSQLCEDVFGIFKAASAMVAEGGVLTEVGKSAGTQANEGNTSEAAAWDKIEKKAQEVAVAKGIKQAAAITEVIKAHPELYDAYIKAQHGE
jgi:hypothetical protein